MFLLTTVALCCAVVAGALAVLEPVFGQAPAQRIADSRPIDSPNPTSANPTPASPASIRVVGAPFVPNVDPRQR